MKQTLIKNGPLLLLVIVLSCRVNAQPTPSKLESEIHAVLMSNAKMKDLNGIDNTVAASSAKAAHDFSKRFKQTGHTSWIGTREGLVARFQNDAVVTKAYYDRKGRWCANVLTYSQDLLPREIRRQVKSVYFDYDIYFVNEVTVGDKTAYLVRIEDLKTLKTIRIMDGEMEVYENFDKQGPVLHLRNEVSPVY